MIKFSIIFLSVIIFSAIGYWLSKVVIKRLRLKGYLTEITSKIKRIIYGLIALYVLFICSTLIVFMEIHNWSLPFALILMTMEVSGIIISTIGFWSYLKIIIQDKWQAQDKTGWIFPLLAFGMVLLTVRMSDGFWESETYDIMALILYSITVIWSIISTTIQFKTKNPERQTTLGITIFICLPILLLLILGLVVILT